MIITSMSDFVLVGDRQVLRRRTVGRFSVELNVLGILLCFHVFRKGFKEIGETDRLFFRIIRLFPDECMEKQDVPGVTSLVAQRRFDTSRYGSLPNAW